MADTPKPAGSNHRETAQRPNGSPPEEITCEDVTHIYPGELSPAVDHVSFHAAAGSFSVLLGSSGCGKTTLLKMINRLIEPTSGRIYVGGVEIHDLPATQLRRGIGYVIQQVGLFPHMTIQQNIAIVPHLEGWPEQAIQQQVSALLEMVHLPQAYLKRYPRNLSGGEQQRVGLARALAADPGILLMDEPFGALDAITRKNLQDELLQIQSKVGKTVLFVTHDVDEAIKLGSQIVVMQSGKIVQAGSPLELISHPRDAFVAELVGSDNLLRRLSVMTAEDILASQGNAAEYHQPETTAGESSVTLQDDLRSVLSVMLKNGVDQITVTNGDGHPAGSIRFNDLRMVIQ